MQIIGARTAAEVPLQLPYGADVTGERIGQEPPLMRERQLCCEAPRPVFFMRAAPRQPCRSEAAGMVLSTQVSLDAPEDEPHTRPHAAVPRLAGTVMAKSPGIARVAATSPTWA